MEPIERNMAAKGVKWHQGALHRQLFKGKSKLPIIYKTTLSIKTNGDQTARPYPLPHVAQLVKWFRNERTHFSSSV